MYPGPLFFGQEATEKEGPSNCVHCLHMYDNDIIPHKQNHCDVTSIEGVIMRLSRLKQQNHWVQLGHEQTG